MDVIFSLIILIITLPFSLLALLLIKITQMSDGGLTHPLFYKETRMSNGVPFMMYKFNIFKHRMIIEARSRNEFIHTKHFEKNGGITKIGWILKQIYMDELPQFYNVLKGDLSVVGPRPVNLEVYEKLTSTGYVAKNEVRAGITGRYQSLKNSTDLNRASDKDMDREYADFYNNNNWYKILLYDISIMLKTLKVIFRAKGV